jgi:hypothetical protein
MSRPPCINQLNPSLIEAEPKKALPGADWIRIRLHGTNVVYCTASINGVASSVYVDTGIMQYHGRWTETDIAQYLVKQLGEVR